MDPTLENKFKINGWLRDLTYPKFLITMIVFALLFYFKTNSHIDNKFIHLDSEREQVAMSLITQYDMTRGANLGMIRLQHEIDAMKAILAKYEQEGKLQTPEEKKELIRQVIREYNNNK